VPQVSLDKEWKPDETEPGANRGFLVQVDAPAANVARARPVRVSHVRAPASGVLGATCIGHAAREDAATPNPGTERLGNGSGIADPMLVTKTVGLRAPRE
jgi:hypothetical protein